MAVVPVRAEVAKGGAIAGHAIPLWAIRPSGYLNGLRGLGFGLLDLTGTLTYPY